MYSGELNTPAIIEGVKKIKAAFPSLPAGFYDVFADRIKDNGFNDDRLRDAVNHVIDNCRYPNPSIADFISFDKRIEVLSYSQILEKMDKIGPSVWKDYKAVMLGGYKKPVYINIAEADSLGLKYQLYKKPAKNAQN